MAREREIDVNDDFAQSLLQRAAPHPRREPRAFYNSDGDCIEFLFSDVSYYAERVDDLLTVYYGRESGEIVGSLIKGVKRFVRDVVQSSPGFVIEVVDGRVRLEHLFTAGMWKRLGDPPVVMTYKKLREEAGRLNLEVDVPELV